MITQSELDAVKLSPTKKDFYQIWNELLDTSIKISERWDPTSTNENDPGIVLLKVLTAIADKLNYNIDKNILEAYMPSAAQEESMRKLCEALGYFMKYYQSATTEVTISYTKALEDADIIEIPAFTTITNLEKDVNYFTLTGVTITKQMPSVTVTCMEGQRVECETENDDLITLAQLDDNFRYFIPETQIAENGIFVYNLNDTNTVDIWQKVNNLNTQPAGSAVFKFGYSSKAGLPYIQFPADVGNLIKDGFKIFYTRTNGINGNISANTLSSLEKPAIANVISSAISWDELSLEDFKVANLSATGNGKNKETINQAYNNYKKTIGTFDTLVTCRDYMNKIYSLINDESIPLVSNIIVSDIRDDINRSYTLCSFDEFGITYSDYSHKDNQSHDLIGHFNLMLYPFQTVMGLGTEKEYENSFKYDGIKLSEIKARLADTKTISHIFTLPDENEIVCIKNYLKLNARITTTNKVNIIEEKNILTNIYQAIYLAFNSRQLDFGEEIPFDSILECIQNADTRIKNVALEEPVLYTKFACADGNEYDIASMSNNEMTKRLYNKMVLKNILAGKIALFNYNTDFVASLSEKEYTNSYNIINNQPEDPFSPIYPTDDNKLIGITSEYTVFTNNKQVVDLTLADNEVIQFRAPNLKTVITYPAYVNYYMQFGGDPALTDLAYPATFYKLMDFMHQIVSGTEDRFGAICSAGGTEGTLATYTSNHWSAGGSELWTETTINNSSAFNSAEARYGALYYFQEGDGFFRVSNYMPTTQTYWYLKLNNDTLPFWVHWLQSLSTTGATNIWQPLVGLYRITSSGNLIGQLTDYQGYKYKKIENIPTPTSGQSILDICFVQQTWQNDQAPVEEGNVYNYTDSHTKDGLGKNATARSLPANSEYQLQENDHLYINYTKASDADGTATQNIVINQDYTYPTIIRPNFELQDSGDLRTSGKSFAKTSGFDQTWGIDGMFSLGASEQIEIRKPIEVTLGQTDTNIFIYWELQSDKNETNGTEVVFPFGSDNSYTLKEGEYFYYTDINKIDMAYYGNGTKISRSSNDLVLKKTLNNDISSEDILTKGLTAIPWIKQYVTEQKYLTIKEYQYITLTKGDTFSCTLEEDSNIDNSWKKCLDATYIYASEAAETETTSHSLPVFNIRDTFWEIRSKLNFNLGPNKTQALSYTTADYVGSFAVASYDSFTLKYNNGTTIQIAPRQKTNQHAIGIIPVSLKANYLSQAAIDTLDTHVVKVATDGTEEQVDDFKIKVFENSPVAYCQYDITDSTNRVPVKEGDLVNLNAFSINYTKVAFSELQKTTESGAEVKGINLNALLTDAQYGLLMLYYITTKADVTSANAQLFASESNAISIFNKTNEDWNNQSIDKVIILRPGLNLIKISKSCRLGIFPTNYGDNPDISDVIIFSNLSIVDNTGSTNGLNLTQLNYQKISEASKAAQLLSDLKALDTNYNFYASCPIENSQAIEINPLLTGNEQETLSTPRIWYDYNNVANKFVISEIDSKEMKKGITIARSSKL